jgi:hypothetical protein
MAQKLLVAWNNDDSDAESTGMGNAEFHPHVTRNDLPDLA